MVPLVAKIVVQKHANKNVEKQKNKDFLFCIWFWSPSHKRIKRGLLFIHATSPE